MHSRYRHFIPALALALTASCSPIAYVNFPDTGGEDGGVGRDGGIQSRGINFKMIGSRIDHVPDKDNVVGMGLINCPEVLSTNGTVEFKYNYDSENGRICGARSMIHQVICRYQPDAASSDEHVAGLNFSEDAVLPYVIHSVPHEMNTFQAIGTVVVRYKDPANSGSELVQMVSITKPGAAVLDTDHNKTVIEGGSVPIKRDSTIRIPGNVKMRDLVSLEIYATVHCAVYKEITSSQIEPKFANGGTLLKMDKVGQFSWKISNFSIDTIVR